MYIFARDAKQEKTEIGISMDVWHATNLLGTADTGASAPVLLVALVVVLVNAGTGGRKIMNGSASCCCRSCDRPLVEVRGRGNAPKKRKSGDRPRDIHPLEPPGGVYPPGMSCGVGIQRAGRGHRHP